MGNTERTSSVQMIADREIIEHLIDHWRMEHDANAENERTYSTGDGYEIQWWGA